MFLAWRWFRAVTLTSPLSCVWQAIIGDDVDGNAFQWMCMVDVLIEDVRLIWRAALHTLSHQAAFFGLPVRTGKPGARHVTVVCSKAVARNLPRLWHHGKKVPQLAIAGIWMTQVVQDVSVPSVFAISASCCNVLFTLFKIRRAKRGDKKKRKSQELRRDRGQGGPPPRPSRSARAV